MKRFVCLVALSALVVLFVVGAGVRQSTGTADATSFVAITNQEAATLFGAAGCGPALQVIGTGCSSPGCNPKGSQYNQLQQGSSNWNPVANTCQSPIRGGGTCGGWDDLQRCGT